MNDSSSDSFYRHVETILDELRAEGFYKRETMIDSAQGAMVWARDEHGRVRQFLNLCANNYLGFSADPMLIEAAKQALDEHGFGMSSVRFICGTQALHRELEKELAAFLRFEDSILFPSCFDANAGLFETLLDEKDAVISDALNHASIIDGVKLCKAERFRYANGDMDALESCLKRASACRYRLIITDGVFSMDGLIAPLADIVGLARRYGALVAVDDSHGVGVLGEEGRGVLAHCRVEGHVDMVTGTLGKALGGASGGYVAARRPIIDLLRQRARPYLFSNAVAPAIVAAALVAIRAVDERRRRQQKLMDNTHYFREKLSRSALSVIEGIHPIVPIMFGEARRAQEAALSLAESGVLVKAFSFPVVPRGAARIRVQLSASHSPSMLDEAALLFAGLS